MTSPFFFVHISSSSTSPSPLTKQWLLCVPPSSLRRLDLSLLLRRPYPFSSLPRLQSHSAALVFMVDEENPLGRNSFSSATAVSSFSSSSLVLRLHVLRLSSAFREPEEEEGRKGRGRTEKTNGTHCLHRLRRRLLRVSLLRFWQDQVAGRRNRAKKDRKGYYIYLVSFSLLNPKVKRRRHDRVKRISVLIRLGSITFYTRTTKTRSLRHTRD